MLSRREQIFSASIVLLFLSEGRGLAAPNEPSPQNESASQLGEEGELRLAISHYDAGRYDLCVDALALLLDPGELRRLRSASRIETARVYHGACLIGVGRTQDAEAVFRDAILENPQMKTPDSLLFPESVVELFLRVRQSLLEEIRKAEHRRMKVAEERAAREQALRQFDQKRVEELLKLAERETVIEQRHRYLAFVPYGVGQFQNQNKGLGWFFLGSEAAVTAVLVSSMYMTAWYGSKTDDPGVTQSERRELSSAQRDAYLVSTISGWGLLGLSVVGIVEANTSFAAELKRERKRELPKGLRNVQPGPSRKGASDTSITWSIVPAVEKSSFGGVITGRF